MNVVTLYNSFEHHNEPRQTLQALALGNNRLGDEEAKLLADALKLNKVRKTSCLLQIT